MSAREAVWPATCASGDALRKVARARPTVTACPVSRERATSPTRESVAASVRRTRAMLISACGVIVGAHRTIVPPVRV